VLRRRLRLAVACTKDPGNRGDRLASYSGKKYLDFFYLKQKISSSQLKESRSESFRVTLLLKTKKISAQIKIGDQLTASTSYLG